MQTYLERRVLQLSFVATELQLKEAALKTKLEAPFRRGHYKVAITFNLLETLKYWQKKWYW